MKDSNEVEVLANGSAKPSHKGLEELLTTIGEAVFLYLSCSFCITAVLLYGLV